VASFEGWEVIRACVTHGAATGDDIAELVTVLLQGAAAAR
jgi:hypothetical protein